MECFDCGKTLDKGDLLQQSCQACGEALMPDDVAQLEKELGIVRKAPEVVAPVLQPEGGIKVPDMMECKSCGVPLYLDDLKTYLNGGDCTYCGTPDPDAVAKQSAPEPVVDAKPDLEIPEVPESVNKSISHGDPMTAFVYGDPANIANGIEIRVRLCTGPLAGFEFNLPYDKIIGREFLSKAISEECSKIASKWDVTALNPPPKKEWYAKSLSRISREHFKVNFSGTIEDMGSANNTYLDREEVFGEGDVFELGKVLSIADELMLTRVHFEGMADTHDPTGDGLGINIRHAQTGISIDVPSGKKFHLGRLREDGRREPFAFAIEDHMTRMDGMNHDDLRRISRRHVTLEVDSDGDVSIENIDGKPVSIVSSEYITGGGPNREEVDLDAANTNYSTKLSPLYDGVVVHDIHITIGKMTFIITRNS